MSLFRILDEYFKKRKILHISGAYNTGKSVLIKDFIKRFYEINDDSAGPKFFIIDTEKKFSKKKYEENFSKDILTTKIFINRSHNSIQLLRTLKMLIDNDDLLKKGDFLIIDSISEFIKQNMTNVHDYQEWKAEVEYMKARLLPMLIRLVIKTGVNLIMVHHVSYNPELEREIPYYLDFFRIIKGMWVFLEKSFNLNGDPLFHLNLNYRIDVEDKNGILIPKIYEKDFTYEIMDGTIKIN